MRTAVGSMLLLLLSGVGWFLYQRGAEPKLGAPPAELKSAFHSEEEWMVGEIVRDIAEMSQFARAGRFEAGVANVALSKASSKPETWLASATLPGRPAVAVELPLRTGVWSSAEYEPLARALVEGLGGDKEPPSPDEALLGTLRDLRAAVIERENLRVSERLKAKMTSSTAHEEAALLLGAFALREAAGWFSDERQVLCRLTAHLALADALRGGPERGVAGRYAHAILLIQSRRTAESLEVLNALDRGAGDSAVQGAWSRALRLRATDDWRMLGQPKTRSLLERLAYYRALVNSSMEALALSMARDESLEPVADWGRITTGRKLQVEEGHLFLRPAQAHERAEIAEVREASGARPLEDQAKLIDALNEPAGRCLTAAGPRVIGWGTWAAFFQRHIAEHVHRVDLFLRWTIDLEQEADARQPQLDRDWGGLVLFPMAACYRVRGQEQNFDRIKDAIDVALVRPELMVAINWAHLASGTRYEVLDYGMARTEDWFTTGFPRGTVYDHHRLHWLKTARATEPGVLESLAAIDPYNAMIVMRRTEALARRKAGAPELLRTLGPRADYDLGALRNVSNELEKQPEQRLAIVERLCAIDTYHCVQLGFMQASRGLDDQAAATLERAIADPTVDRVRASHAGPWLEAYHRERGRTQRALEIATQAAETGSGSGFVAMSQHWEALGRFDEAERYHVEASDRYKDDKYDCDSSLVAFYYRMARLRNDTAFEPKLQRCLVKTFPQGLQHVELKDLSGPPTDGVFVNGHTDETLKQGIWAGDVIVGLDGWRVRTTEQYWAVNSFTLATDVPQDMTFIVWKAGAYREVKAKFLKGPSVPLDNYPLKGWVEK
jgi:hypothetical protein